MIDLLRLRPMNNSMKIFGLLMICASFSGSCKRCYQCVVRDSADNDIQWVYKEVCVTKKDYEDYFTICEDAAAAGTSDTLSLYCDCAENLMIE